LRDAPSKVVDNYTGPYPYINDVPVRNSVFGLNIVDTRASLLSSEKLITGDKYTFIRNAYLQNREFKVKDGKVVDDF
jgi:phospholipid-binding lipoprotein MlaA